MLRRPPRSTRTDTLLSLHDALPILGFPIAVIMGWMFDLGPRGAERAVAIPAEADSGAAASVGAPASAGPLPRSEEHTSELQSLMRISYAVFCLNNKNNRCTHSDTYEENT